MKVKIKKSVLKEAIERQCNYILENKSTPLMSATFKLLDLYESSNKTQRKTLKDVFKLLEQELYLEDSAITSLAEECYDKMEESEDSDKKECPTCKDIECKCKKV